MFAFSPNGPFSAPEGRRLGSVLACWFVGRGPKTGVLSRTVFWVWGGFLGLGEVRDLYRKVGDIGGLHFHQVPSKSVPRGAKTSQKTVYLRIPSEQTTCCFLQARTEPSRVLQLKGLTGVDMGGEG